MSKGTQDDARWLSEEWIAKATGSIETMTERRPGLTQSARIPVNAPEALAEMLWYSIPLNLSPTTAFFIGAAHENWLSIGKSALRAAGVDEASEADSRATFVEIITQSTSAVAQSIAARLGQAVASLPPVESRFSDCEGAVDLTPIEITLSGLAPLKIYLSWSEALEQMLAGSTANHQKLVRAGGSGIKRTELEKSHTLDVLMEVELPVSVSFGRTELPLRDVLKLNSGSIVELNRTITDPVEIIVNNCVIARGEVVVIDGNYGVRIHHVVSREERLRTLK